VRKFPLGETAVACLWLVLLRPAFILAGLTGMAGDQPRMPSSLPEFWREAYFWSLWAIPFGMAVGVLVGPLAAYRGHRRVAWIALASPILAIAVCAIAFRLTS
jgi:MFS family permease